MKPVDRISMNKGSSAHTQGEWLLNGQPNPLDPQYFTIFVQEGGPETIEHICQISKQMSVNYKAHAHLIAAAPNLLKACKIALHRIFMLDRDCENSKAYCDLNHAIAKAGIVE